MYIGKEVMKNEHPRSTTTSRTGRVDLIGKPLGTKGRHWGAIRSCEVAASCAAVVQIGLVSAYGCNAPDFKNSLPNDWQFMVTSRVVAAKSPSCIIVVASPALPQTNRDGTEAIHVCPYWWHLQGVAKSH